MAITFPLKALVQSTGDVILGEFLESDYVGILDGGIGAGGNGGLASTATEAEKLVAIKQQMRSNFSFSKVKFKELNCLKLIFFAKPITLFLDLIKFSRLDLSVLP